MYGLDSSHIDHDGDLMDTSNNTISNINQQLNLGKKRRTGAKAKQVSGQQIM